MEILPPGNTVTGDEKDEVEVNSLGDLLWHIEEKVADDDLNDVMISMRERVAEFYDWDVDEVYGDDGLSNLRNTWLHGQEPAGAEYGIILNYISLIVWGVLTDSLAE